MTQNSPATGRTKPFTGRHATLILVLFFGTVAAVNFTMASYATSTFGGVVVENSYVASQEFNEWLDKAEEQKALGWTVTQDWREDGHVEVLLSNVPAEAVVSAIARHPLGREADIALRFSRAEGDITRFVSDTPLPTGRWIIRTQVDAGGNLWRGEEHIR
ncbi:FixH family protein [Pontixanthobacter aestiaquae]|uniref:Nitrogen fixation protein FixH n=1 Tax=Pontixanthobacter aestiaquae TaxID=1509367 RepID=A0A844Z3D8_9SPHN|nr:FixH family protein [Pontixanthobacter aestiaquae]MDN3647248.1 FixH family protein [Pontixanthobacter aestiaquae]MXO81776.1 hypothetical protein [Pontixanthobacter aestiaquae]